MQKKSELFITCPPFVTPYLKLELEQLQIPVLNEIHTGVFTTADYNQIIRLNFCLRTANRVLIKINSFNAHDLKSLYNGLKKINWDDYFSFKKYLSFTSQTNHPSINNTMFLNQHCKDAVVDFFNDKYKVRPSSGPLRSEVVIHIHWHDNMAVVYLDTSGDQLNKHGYRQNPFMAPVQENLAAALIMATGWNKKQAFINPMCGSGTFAIEAALMAANKFPLAMRQNFSFMHYTMFNKTDFEKIKKETSEASTHNNVPAIIATDKDKFAIRASRENAARAGVEHLIAFEQCDFTETKIEGGDGTVLINPPYGERLGSEHDLENLYKSIGDFFKQKCKGKTGFIFTGESFLAKKVGLRTSRKMEFYNGPIECRLLKYDLY